MGGKSQSASKKRPQSGSTAVAKPYAPNERETAVLESYRERRRSTKPLPRFKIAGKDSSGLKIELDHDDLATASALVMESMASADPDFFMGATNDLANITAAKGQPLSEARLNYALSIVAGVNPRDEIETLLGIQMAAVHMATVTFARRLAHVDNIPQQDSAERALNKLARTFTTQVEALKRYRSKGEQKVTVEHVTVNEGGQAIVGAVDTGRG